MLIADDVFRAPMRPGESEGAGSWPATAVFFALYPDGDTAVHIGWFARQLRRRYSLTGRPLADRNFHVSLLNIGEHRLSRTPTPAAALDLVTSAITMPSFKVGFDRARSFGRGKTRPLVLAGADERLAGIALLRRELIAAWQRLDPGYRSDTRPYEPHVTLLYGEMPDIDEAIRSIGWTVRELVLVRSFQGYGRHVPIARWPLLPGA